MIDANPQDIGMTDYVLPDGTAVPITIGDYRQLSDALFHAGTDSGSEFEYVDEANRLHFYVLDVAARRRPACCPTRSRSARSTAPGPQRRGVRLLPAAGLPTGDGWATLPLPAAQHRQGRPSAGQHPEDVSAYLRSDVYRLSADARTRGWSVWVPNELAATEFGAHRPGHGLRQARVRQPRRADHADRHLGERRGQGRHGHLPGGRAVIEEARLEDVGTGLAPVSPGWFVVNAADAAWVRNDAFGNRCVFESSDRVLMDRPDLEPQYFTQIGFTLAVLEPGKPSGMYHAESSQEDFLVLHGTCLLLIEEQERELRAWDFVHCPPGTNHTFVGTGDGPCVIFMTGARREDDTINYPRSDIALGARRRRRDGDAAPGRGLRAVRAVAARPPGLAYAVNSKRVPTLFWMNASGNRAAIAWMARQPVQWQGTRWSGANSPSAWQVGAMIFSNTGPLRWKPPITAWMRSSPVSFRT